MPDEPWLLLIHHIPPRPAYLRVKVGRRLQGLGAVAVKSSVYVLPRTDQAREDFQWLRGEIVAGGGDAAVCAARFLDGLSDGDVEALFNAAREAEYAELGRAARALKTAAGGKRRRVGREGAAGLARLRKQMAAVVARDFFAAPGRAAVERLLASVAAALHPAAPPPAAVPRRPQRRGRTWTALRATGRRMR